MEILESKIMRGPNYWSVKHKSLIVLKIKTDELSAADRKDFIRKATTALPQLALKLQPEQFTDNELAHATRVLAVELQKMAGMPVEFSDVIRGKQKNEHVIIYSYQTEEAGLRAGEAAVLLCNAILRNIKHDIEDDLDELRYLKKRFGYGATSGYILEEVKKRSIPFRRFNRSSLLTLGYGVKQKLMRTAVTGNTSGIGIELAGDKEETKELLARSYVPVPKGILVYSEEELRDRLHDVRFPVVVKPLGGNQGRGVTTNINSMEKVVFGFHISKRVSDHVIVEEYIEGDDFRFLVINYQLVAVARRTPAHVIGDGHSTIEQLIRKENTNPLRGTSEEHVLALIKVDDITTRILRDKNLSLDTVLPNNERLVLKDTANISAGGIATDVTELVHPENKFMAERIARLFNLDICGVDIIAKDIEVPITRDNGAVIEVNAGPGVRMHSNPQGGESRNVAAPIIEMVFPPGHSPRIPIAAITGTNGKTTVTRLIAHIVKHAGYTPGYTTTDGIYINGHRIYTGDCTGYYSAQDVLFDPTVNFAVLECARGGILKSGLGFDQCDVSVVTNVTEDHLGMKDIDTVEEMARVKMVVPLSTKKNGYAILNADDELVYKMREELSCHIALFSMDENNSRIIQHCAEGGIAAVIENGHLTIRHGQHKTRLDRLENIPLTIDGRADSMIKNLMPAVLAAYASGVQTDVINQALQTFIPSPSQTPGRMNIFKFGHFEIMLDYAHNFDGYTELKKFMEKTRAAVKVGVIGVAGDRKDEDIIRVGKVAANTFDEIIIRHDKDMRGRPTDEMTDLLTEGIRSVNKQVPVQVISDETEAIQYCIDHAKDNSFVVVCTEKVEESIDYLTRALNDRLIQKRERTTH